MQETLLTYGYIILFLYSIGGGMAAIIAAGVLSHMGQMNLTISILLAAIANTIGDTIFFYLGRYNKQLIMPYLREHRRKIAYSHMLMKKQGDKIIFFKKFVYGLKTLVPVAIGLTRYSFYKFSVINAVSSLLWAVILGVLSYYMGGLLQQVGDYVSENGWIMPAVLFTLLGGIWYFLKKVTKKKGKR